MRSFLLSLLLLAVVGPAAAHAATIRIEQQGPNGEPITGGCYKAYNDDYQVERCDYKNDEDPGVILLPNLGGGTFDVKEYNAPPGYYATSDFTVTLAGTDPDEVDRRARRHQARPLLRVVTTDAGGKPMTGSCWFVRIVGDREGGWDECDADDGSADGVTRFLDLEAGAYELLHVRAPAGIDRVDTTAFTMPAAEDKTLTFALEPAVPPANTVAPSIKGGHTVGDGLTASVGTWTGSAEIDYLDAWERCDLDGKGCVAAEDYDETYTVTAKDAGKALRYRVTAVNDGGHVTAWSTLHAIASLDLPEPTSEPSISGSTALGGTLTADPGEWTNAPTFTYQWQRCAADCTDIANATGATYRTVKADAKLRIRVIVTAHNSAGERSATSAQTEPINDAPWSQVRPSTTGTPAAHNVMEAFPGSWGTHYAPLSFAYVWLRCDLDGSNHCQRLFEGDHYLVRQEDEGHTLVAEVTATDANGGSATARSNPRTVLIQRPLPTERPSITGVMRTGQKLTAHVGTWTPKPTAIKFYWERCYQGQPNVCKKIEGSDGDRTYKLTREKDAFDSFRLVVWAYGPEGAGYERSDMTERLRLYPPVNIVPPSISGVAIVGHKLRGDRGVWQGPIDWSIYPRWFRCEPEDVEGKHCKQITDSDDMFDREYKLRPSDVGYTIRFEAIAANDDGATYLKSAPTEVVTAIPPVNTAGPSISGQARLGQKLTANRGTWTADGKLELKHWWTRCNADGEACQTISGSENDKTHTVSRDDLHYTLKLRVLATGLEGEAEAWSEPTAQIEQQPPVALANPSISGTSRVDAKLTANLGEWTSALNLHLNVRWYRCETNGTGCVAIDGADDRTYRLRYTDIDHRIKLQVTATSDEGTGTAWSATTDIIVR